MYRRQALLILFAMPFAAGSAVLSDDVAETERNFFPVGVFDDSSNIDEHIRDWYSKQLRALEEPSLYSPKQDAEVYRFTWLRTFHNPMVFRFVVHDHGSGTLTVKRASGTGGYEPGVVDLKKEIALTSSQVDELKKMLNDMSYWEQSTKLETMGLDGAQWIVEANLNGKYKIVDRWTNSDPAIQAWGMQLIVLSGVEVGKVY
jgi:hypothetical protein